MNIGILTDDIEFLIELSKNFKVTTNIEDLEFCDVIVLISYSKIITKERLQNKIYLNVHNSLLPKYRGLHAFTWGIINGERQLGYTLHKAEPRIDSGPIVSQVKFYVEDNENINDIFIKGQKVLINWLQQELELLNFEKIDNARVQNELLATYVTKRKPEDNLIDWNQPARNIFNFVRALTPPYTKGAFSFLANEIVRILEVKYLNIPNYIERPGNIVNKEQNGIWVKVQDGVVLINKISIEEKLYEGNNIMLKIGDKFVGYES